jgi:hypothetical protein
VDRADFPAIQLYYTQQPLLVDKMKGDLYVVARGPMDYIEPGSWSGTMFLKIPDLNEESAVHLFELPAHLYKKYIQGAYFSHSSHVMNDNRYIVFGIPFYNNLLTYDLETGETVEKSAGSKYFGDVLPWDNPQMDGHEEFYVTSNFYRELAYGKENQLLYRLAYRKVGYAGRDGKNRNWDNKPPSDIIINGDFEKVGEFDLPVNTIYSRMFFTHDGKLYLSLNHPDTNPSDDQMVFVGFRPERL